MSYLSPQFLTRFREEFRLSCFVETGCYVGDGIAAAIGAGFSMVRSCDISPKHIDHCRQRFSDTPSVQILQAESVTALRAILQEKLPPCLFWLDAHYPAFYGLEETPQTKVPILEELALIVNLRHGAARDVILADDMRVFAASDNPRWNPAEVPEYFRVHDITIADMTSPFSETHDARIDSGQEGILVLTPKTAALSAEQSK